MVLTGSDLHKAFGPRPGWRWPDPASLAIIGSGVLAAMFATLPVLSLLNVATRFDTVRYE